MNPYTTPALAALDAAHATTDPLGLEAIREYADWLEETDEEYRVLLRRIGQPADETEMGRAARIIQREIARVELLAKAEVTDDDNANPSHVVRNTLLRLVPGQARTYADRERLAR